MILLNDPANTIMCGSNTIKGKVQVIKTLKIDYHFNQGLKKLQRKIKEGQGL